MKAVILDFDGPIFDGRTACQRALRATFLEFAKKGLGTPELQFRSTPLYNPAQLVALAYAQTAPPPETLAQVLNFYVERLQQEERSISADSIVQQLIELLRGRGIKLAIISSREAENLSRIVKRLGLAGFFDFVQGRDADLTSKAEFIRRFAASNRIQFNDIIFVGDSDRDCEAAEETGVRYYHATWTGEPTSIAHSKANVRFDSPQDLLAVCENLAVPESVADGTLPTPLKEAVRLGQFSFYAGAGVSVPSGVGGWDSHYLPILHELGAGALLATYQLPELLQLLASDETRAQAVFESFANSFRIRHEPNSYHHAMVRSGAERIWTTNYDNLFEQVIASGDYTYQVVKNDNDLKKNFGKRALVIKMNGDFESGGYDKELDWGMVFLQEQFDLADKQRAEIWRLFEDDYRNRSIIFVGVSFRDPTLRRITAAAAKNAPITHYPHYLLMHLPRHPVEIAEFHLFTNYLRRYRINVLGFREFKDIDRFVRRITALAKRPIVGFSGTTAKNNDPSKTLPGGSIDGTMISALCQILGRALARRGMRVTSGHGPGVGVPSVEAAFEADPTSARFYVRRKGTSNLSRTAPAIVVNAEKLETMRERFIPECDLLFAAGGDSDKGESSGTVLEINRALTLQIPVLIFEQAGGDVAAYAATYLAKIDGAYEDKAFGAEIKRANEMLRDLKLDDLEGFFATNAPRMIEDLIAAFTGSSTKRPRPKEDPQW